MGQAVARFIEAQSHKTEVHRFDSRKRHWNFPLT